MNAPMNAPVPEKPVPALGYDVAPPEGYVSRRKYRFLMVLTVCNTLLLVALVGGPLVWRLAREARDRHLARQAAAVAQAQAAQAQAAAAQAQAARAQALSARRTAVTVAPAVSGYQRERDMRRQASDRLLSHTRPSEQAVYEEDPVAARKLLSSPGASGPPEYRALSLSNIDSRYASSFQAPVIIRDVSTMSPFDRNDNDRDRGILFVHGLTSPAGNKRIVFLELKVDSTGGSPQRTKGQQYEIRLERQLYYRIFTPADASANRDPAVARDGPSLQVRTTGGDVFPVRWVDGVLRTDREPGKSLRFYGGQPDPKDPSHFTVDYEFDGQRGTIDGWLTDDDFLRIRPRGGEVDGGTWYVNGRPEGAGGPR
jgi:hypothetical protein